MKMTQKAIERLRTTGRKYYKPDSQCLGLYINVAKSGTMGWSYKNMINKARPEIVLGDFPTVSVEEARRRHAKIAELHQDGGLPDGVNDYRTIIRATKRLANQERRDGENGVVDQIQKQRSPRFAEVVRQYLADGFKTKSTAYRNDVRQTLEANLLPAWMNRAIGTITYDELSTIIADYQKVEDRQYGARKIHVAASALWSWAIEKKTKGSLRHLMPHKVKRPKLIVDARENVLRREDIPALADVCETYGIETDIEKEQAKPRRRKDGSYIRGSHIKGMMSDWSRYCQRTAAHLVWLEVLLGQRGVELQRMEWSHLRTTRDGILWTLPKETTKNKTTHKIPMSEQAAAILIERGLEDQSLRRSTTWVFPNQSGTGHLGGIKGSIKSIYKRAGFAFGKDEITRHDLRRTCSTGMASLKDEHNRSLIPNEMISRILNHKTGSGKGSKNQTARYNHWGYESEMRAALQLWADEIDKIRDEEQQRKATKQGAKKTKAIPFRRTA